MKRVRDRLFPWNLTAAVLFFAAVAAPVPDDDSAGAESPPATSTESIQVEPELEALLQEVAPTISARLGGAWANPDGTVTVALTGEDAVPSPLTAHPKVRIVSVRFSHERLRTTIQTATTRLNTLLAPGTEPGSDTLSPWPFTGRINTREAVVEFTIGADHESKRAVIEAALVDELRAGTLRISYGAVPRERDDCGTRSSCVGIFRGGTRASHESGGSCTFGFVMRDRSIGVRYQSTAGHCGARATWSHNGRNVGPSYTEKYVQSGYMDFQAIWQTSHERQPRNWIYRDSNTATAITLKITSPGASLLGNPLCLNGFVGGEDCGTLSAIEVTHNGQCCFGEIVGGESCGGDSGGPVVNQVTNRAYGFHRGSVQAPGANCGTPMRFAWVPYQEGPTNTEVLLKPTSESLGSGQRMDAGDYLESINGVYRLNMQDDGNLVLHQNGNPVWASGTNGYWGAYAVMQTAGNLVIYHSGVARWARPTPSGWTAGSYLSVNDDGNVVVYRPDRSASWHRFCNCTLT